MKTRVWVFLIAVPLGLIAAGCASKRPFTALRDGDVPEVALSGTAGTAEVASHDKPDADLESVSATDSVQLVGVQETTLPAPEPAESPDSMPSVRNRPAYSQLETLPIDLPNVIRLVNSNSPLVAYAQAKVREAQSRLESAEVQWLPNLSAGTTYNRFDGQTQNQRGEVFPKSRANLFESGGLALTVDFAEAIYRPLIERRMVSSEQFRADAANLAVELEAVGAYLDLVQVHAQLDINTGILAKAEEMLTAAKNAQAAQLSRVAGDVNRARAEFLSRRIERIEIEGRIGATSARLGKLLLLQPNVRLVPADVAVVPVTLVSPDSTLDDLVALAISNRPELASVREMVAAAWERVRKEERAVLLPKLIVQDQAGVFGGGLNDTLGQFAGRNALSAQLYWEIKNLGFGNRAAQAERRAVLDQVYFQQLDTQARVAAEIVEVAQIAAAKYESLDLAERAVQEATELYRVNKDGSIHVIDAKNLFDALRPLQAIQLLSQTQLNYLAAVLDFNRAQYRLFAAIGGCHQFGDTVQALNNGPALNDEAVDGK